MIIKLRKLLVNRMVILFLPAPYLIVSLSPTPPHTIQVSSTHLFPVSGVWVMQKGHCGDGCDLASTLCKYDTRKGDLFVLTWASMRRLKRGSVYSELLICGGCVRNILSLPLVARCLETTDVCRWRMFVFMSVVQTVCGLWGCLLCSGRC